MSTCGNPRCTAKTPRGQLACRPCWFALPKPLRDGINSTWRNRKRDGIEAYFQNYREARRLWVDQAAKP